VDLETLVNDILKDDHFKTFGRVVRLLSYESNLNNDYRLISTAAFKYPIELDKILVEREYNLKLYSKYSLMNLRYVLLLFHSLLAQQYRSLLTPEVDINMLKSMPGDVGNSNVPEKFRQYKVGPSVFFVMMCVTKTYKNIINNSSAVKTILPLLIHFWQTEKSFIDTGPYELAVLSNVVLATINELEKYLTIKNVTLPFTAEVYRFRIWKSSNLLIYKNQLRREI